MMCWEGVWDSGTSWGAAPACRMDLLGFLCGTPTLVFSLCQKQRAGSVSWAPVPAWDADSGFGASQACGTTSGVTIWFCFAGEKLPPLSAPSSLSRVSPGTQT